MCPIISLQGDICDINRYKNKKSFEPCHHFSQEPPKLFFWWDYDPNWDRGFHDTPTLQRFLKMIQLGQLEKKQRAMKNVMFTVFFWSALFVLERQPTVTGNLYSNKCLPEVLKGHWCMAPVVISLRSLILASLRVTGKSPLKYSNWHL